MIPPPSPPTPPLLWQVHEAGGGVEGAGAREVLVRTGDAGSFDRDGRLWILKYDMLTTQDIIDNQVFLLKTYTLPPTLRLIPHRKS